MRIKDTLPFSEYSPDPSFMINPGHSMSPVYLVQKDDSR